MDFLQVILLIFLIFSALYPKISSQTLTCGDNSFFIQYPFKLLQENQNPKTKSHSKFILKCNNQGLTVLSIPFSGDFYVRDIDYFDHKIQLYDPGNCLPGRLMNLSLSTSPFVAVAYQNYTFFSCKHESLILRNYSVIDCLSNSTTYVLATSLQSRRNEIMKLKGCNVIVNMKIAVSSLDQYENNGFEGDLQLAWNDQNCYGDCKGKSQSISVVSIILLCCITIAIAILCTLFCTGCCLRFTGFILEYKDANNRRLHRSTRVLQMTRINLPLAQPQPLSSPPRSNFLTVNDPWMSFSPGEPSVTTTPSLETRITLFLAQPEPIPSPPRPPNDTSWMSFSPEAPSVTTTPNREEFSSTEVLIIGGKECISGPNSDSCSICLQDYTASERLRRICKCDHCFHAHCLETWLQAKNTCPFCRIEVD